MNLSLETKPTGSATEVLCFHRLEILDFMGNTVVIFFIRQVKGNQVGRRNQSDFSGLLLPKQRTAFEG